jgi:hypothetical protein
VEFSVEKRAPDVIGMHQDDCVVVEPSGFQLGQRLPFSN